MGVKWKLVWETWRVKIVGWKNCGGTSGIIIEWAWDKKKNRINNGFSVWPDKFKDSVTFLKIASKLHQNFIKFYQIASKCIKLHQNASNYIKIAINIIKIDIE